MKLENVVVAGVGCMLAAHVSRPAFSEGQDDGAVNAMASGKAQERQFILPNRDSRVGRISKSGAMIRDMETSDLLFRLSWLRFNEDAECPCA